MFSVGRQRNKQKKTKQPPDYLWQLLKSASRPKAYAGGGGGGEVGGAGKREKISAYRVSVSRRRLGTRQGFGIMDKLLIRWGAVAHPPLYLRLSRPASVPSYAAA